MVAVADLGDTVCDMGLPDPSFARRTGIYLIYVFIRRKGNDAEDKLLDLTQSYFARLLEKPAVRPA